MHSSTLCQFICIATWIASSSAKILASPSELPTTTYDYVIVGAGTAGNVVAARLTENEHVSVLVLEAGGSHEGVQASMIPLLAPSLVGTVYDWNYTTTAQHGFNGRTMPYARGKIVGGSSSINFMAYGHGSADDFNRYASVTDDEGWGWDNMEKYRKANERFVPPADGHDTDDQFTPDAHSYSGAVSVSLPGFPVPPDDRVIAAIKEFPADFPYNQDTSGGNMVGVGWTLSSIGNGTRSSSATAYLEPALGRPNLDVLINSHVMKLVQTGTVGELPSFHSVQFASKEGDEITTVTARKEVVLCAGAFGTPTILQLSGIGDRQDLEPLGITTIVDSPSVGKNLSDHVALANIYSVNSTDTFDTIFRSPDILNADIAQWTANKTGPLTCGLSNNLGYLRFPPDSDIFNDFDDLSAGPNSSHYEILVTNLWVDPVSPPPPTGNFMSFMTTLIASTSRGTIRLSSNNPFDAPLIDPNFLATEYDMAAMKATLKASKKLASASAWKDYILSPIGNLANTDTDEEIEHFIRANSSSMSHALGTAAMSPRGASWGVVDPDLKVKGTEGLRVIDGSVIPFPPNAHPQGPIYLFAERGADLIKNDQGPSCIDDDGRNEVAFRQPLVGRLDDF